MGSHDPVDESQCSIMCADDPFARCGGPTDASGEGPISIYDVADTAGKTTEFLGRQKAPGGDRTNSQGQTKQQKTSRVGHKLNFGPGAQAPNHFRGHFAWSTQMPRDGFCGKRDHCVSHLGNLTMRLLRHWKTLWNLFLYFSSAFNHIVHQDALGTKLTDGDTNSCSSVRKLLLFSSWTEFLDSTNIWHNCHFCNFLKQKLLARLFYFAVVLQLTGPTRRVREVWAVPRKACGRERGLRQGCHGRERHRLPGQHLPVHRGAWWRLHSVQLQSTREYGHFFCLCHGLQMQNLQVHPARWKFTRRARTHCVWAAGHITRSGNEVMKNPLQLLLTEWRFDAFSAIPLQMNSLTLDSVRMAQTKGLEPPGSSCVRNRWFFLFFLSHLSTV